MLTRAGPSSQPWGRAARGGAAAPGDEAVGAEGHQREEEVEAAGVLRQAQAEVARLRDEEEGGVAPAPGAAVLAGAMLGFARAIGEFGATVVIAGSIPGATRTLSVAIYTFTETGRDREAVALLAISATIAFAALWLSNRWTDGVRT